MSSFPTGLQIPYVMRQIKLLFVPVFLFLASCSDSPEDLNVQGEVTNSGVFLKSTELLTSNFLPTFTSYYGRDHGTSTNRSSSLASEWIHEYDDDKLVKSSFFELFPYRILKEVTYLDIVDDHKLNYEIKEYRYYSRLYSITNTYELTFDDNLNIERIGDAGTILKELSDEGWVTKINTVTPDGYIVYQTGYEYDEQGNILKYISYDTPGTITSTVDYSYNENGDPLSYHFQNDVGAEARAEYYYREDNTLERMEGEYNYGDDDFGTEIFTYSLEERFSKKITNKGDGLKEVVTYTDDEFAVEYYEEDNLLNEVYVYYIQDESYFLKMHKEYVNGVIHTIKYYDADGDLEYTEYYDENGNLTETVQG